MKVDFTFKHVDRVELLKQLAEGKMHKIEKFGDRFVRVHFLFREEKNRQVVEVTLYSKKGQYKALGADFKFTAAIDHALYKLGRQLARQRSRRSDHKRPSHSNYGHLEQTNSQLEYHPQKRYRGER